MTFAVNDCDCITVWISVWGFLKLLFIIFIIYSLKYLCLYYSEREILVKLSCSCLVLLHGFHYNFCFTIHHFYQSELYLFFFSLWRFWVLFVKFHTSFLSICLLMAVGLLDLFLICFLDFLTPWISTLTSIKWLVFC